jgi:hypothetical protein
MTDKSPADDSGETSIKKPLEGEKHSSQSAGDSAALINSVDMKDWSADLAGSRAISTEVKQLLGRLEIGGHGGKPSALHSKFKSSLAESHKETEPHRLDQSVTSNYFHVKPIPLGSILGNPNLWNKANHIDSEEKNPAHKSEPLHETGELQEKATPPLRVKSDDASLPGGGKIVDMAHSTGVTQTTDDLLKDKKADSYNCVYYAKTYIEDAPPLSLNPTMEGLPGSKYMEKNQFEKVAAPEYKQGDVVFVSMPHPGHLTPDVHAFIVTKVDEHHNILETRQKPDPEHPVQDMNLEQLSINYFGGKTLEELRKEHLAGVWRKSV